MDPGGGVRYLNTPRRRTKHPGTRALREAMRLLVINWQDPANPRAGGAEAHLREIFGGLAAWGHEITLLASGWPGGAALERTEAFEIHRVGNRYSFALHARGYYRRVLATRAFDVVIEDLNKIPLYVPTWTEGPVVLIAHHLFGRSAFGAASVPVATVTCLLEQTLRLAYRRVPVQAVSESTAEDLRRHGLRDEDITVIHNGISLSPQTSRGGGRATHPTFLYLGRLQAYKRVDLILRAVAKRTDSRDPADHCRPRARGTPPTGTRELARHRSARGVCRVRARGGKTRAFGHGLGERLDVDEGGVGDHRARSGGRGNADRRQYRPRAARCGPRRRHRLARGPANVTALTDALARLARDGDYARSLGRAARQLAERSTWERGARQTEAHLAAVASGRVGAAGNPLRVRGRDQRSPVPLPKNGRASASFGCSAIWVDGKWAGRRVRMRFLLGATDSMGHKPVLVLDHLECADANLGLALIELRRSLERVRSLDGWPADPVAFLTASLEQLLGDRWRIGPLGAQRSDSSVCDQLTRWQQVCGEGTGATNSMADGPRPAGHGRCARMMRYHDKVRASARADRHDF